jgi:hypothetical protein
MAYTLAELKTLARQRADMENSTLIRDVELKNYINDSYGELYDLLTASFEDYYLKSPVTFTLTQPANTYSLPSDFYKLRGLDFQLSSSDWTTVTQFNFAERNVRSRLLSRYTTGQRSLSYRVMGSKLYLIPEEECSGTFRLWYVPKVTPLDLDADIMGDVLDFAEYVIIDAAIKCLIKEESDISALMALKQKMELRVTTMAKSRNIDRPERVADVSSQFEAFETLFPRA